MGEIGPTYFASADARRRIADLVPNAKVLCIFRNPVDRIRSHYRLKRAYAMIPWRFEEALNRDPELIESSRYGTHFEAWQQTFGEKNVRPVLYDDLKRNPQGLVDDVANFIGIPRFTVAKSQASHVHSSELLTQPRSYYGTRSASVLADWLKAYHLDRIVAMAKRTPIRNWFLGGGSHFEEIRPDLVSSLYERFRPEVEKLEYLLGRDLGAWKYEEARMMSIA